MNADLIKHARTDKVAICAPARLDTLLGPIESALTLMNAVCLAAMSVGAVDVAKIPLARIGVSVMRVTRNLPRALAVKTPTNAKNLQEYANTTALTLGAAIAAVVSQGTGFILTIGLALTSMNVLSLKIIIFVLGFAIIHLAVIPVGVLRVTDLAVMLERVKVNFYFNQRSCYLFLKI